MEEKMEEDICNSCKYKSVLENDYPCITCRSGIDNGYVPDICVGKLNKHE